MSKEKQQVAEVSTSDDQFDHPTTSNKKRGMTEDKDFLANCRPNKEAAKKCRRASDVIRLVYYSQLCGCDRWRFESVEEEFEFQELFIEEAGEMCSSWPNNSQPSNRDFFHLEEQIYEYMVSKRKKFEN